MAALTAALTLAPASAPTVTPALDPSPCAQLYTQKQARTYIEAVYERPQVTRKARKHIALLVKCQHSDKAKRNVKRFLRSEQRERERRLALTPYRCGAQRYAIPCYIVDCESDFANLSPNWASASGYYQFITSTWLAMGGGKYAPAAYLATKAEQDIVAARLWAGGSGAGHWDCA